MSWCVRDNWMVLHDNAAAGSPPYRAMLGGIVLPRLSPGYWVEVDLTENSLDVKHDGQTVLLLQTNWADPDALRLAITKIMLVAG